MEEGDFLHRYKEELRRRGEDEQRRTEAAAEEQRRMAYSEAQVSHQPLRLWHCEVSVR